MMARRLPLLCLLAGLVAAQVHADTPTEGDRLMQASRAEAERLTRDAADPFQPLIGTEAVVPKVDELAKRYELTKAKLKPAYLAAYQPGAAHAVLQKLGCKVLAATPLGAPVPGQGLNMEAIAYRCADGAEGSVTISRNAPPDVRVGLDMSSVTGRIDNRPAVLRYFRAQQSKRLVILQTWMASPDTLVSLTQALPPSHTEIRRGSAWADARKMAEALDRAYAPH